MRPSFADGDPDGSRVRGTLVATLVRTLAATLEKELMKELIEEFTHRPGCMVRSLRAVLELLQVRAALETWPLGATEDVMEGAD